MDCDMNRNGFLGYFSLISIALPDFCSLSEWTDDRIFEVDIFFSRLHWLTTTHHSILVSKCLIFWICWCSSFPVLPINIWNQDQFHFLNQKTMTSSFATYFFSLPIFSSLHMFLCLMWQHIVHFSAYSQTQSTDKVWILTTISSVRSNFSLFEFLTKGFYFHLLWVLTVYSLVILLSFKMILKQNWQRQNTKM